MTRRNDSQSMPRQRVAPEALDANAKPAHGQPTETVNKGASRRDFLRSTAAMGAGLLLAGKALAQETGAAATAAAPAADAAAGAAAAASAPAALAPSAMRQVNVAVIGLGAEGQVLIEAMKRIPGVNIQAVCDIWEAYNLKMVSRRLKNYGYKLNTYTDYRELLDKEKGLEAVIVATPDFMHHEHTIACLKAGLHVYCEKEMSNSLENARKMVEAQRETGLLLQIGHQRRSNPRYRHAIERVLGEEQLLGQMTHAYGQWNRSNAASLDLTWSKNIEIPSETLEKYGYDSMQQFRNWRWYKKYGGGPIVDLGSHQIDIFTWVFGRPPKALTADGGIDFYKNHEWYDNVMAIFEYETAQGGSARAYYQVVTTTSNGGFYEVFMGIDGVLQISEVPPRGNQFLKEPNVAEDRWKELVKKGLLLEPPKAAPAPKPTKNTAVDVRVSKPLDAWAIPVDLGLKPAHQPHLENFFNGIRVGEALNCPAEIGYETAVSVLRVNEAVEKHQKIFFTPEEFKV